eukprot:30153_1
MSKDIYYNDLPSPFDPGQVMYPRCTTFSDNSADLDQQSANQPGIPRRHVYLGYVPKQSGDNMTRNASSGVSPGRSSSKDLKRVNVLPAGTHKVPKTNRDYGGRSTDSTSGFSSDRGYVPGTAGHTMTSIPHQDYYNSEQDIPSQLIPKQASSDILQHGSRHRKLARNSSFPTNSKQSSVYGENNNQMNLGCGGPTQQHPSSG